MDIYQPAISGSDKELWKAGDTNEVCLFSLDYSLIIRDIPVFSHLGIIADR